MFNPLGKTMSSHVTTKAQDATKENNKSFPAPESSHLCYNETEPTILKWIKSIKPSGAQTVDYITSLFPFSRWIFSYNLQWLAGDLVAGNFALISLEI
jgi:hypothetical protein